VPHAAAIPIRHHQPARPLGQHLLLRIRHNLPADPGVGQPALPHAGFTLLPACDYFPAMNASDLITVDPDILGGTPVFKGTRVPVKTLFDYLEGDYTLEEFLECFPSVTREMAHRLLERSEAALLTLAAA
jgi:uncharacterized protein (DUF433 family)